MAHKVYVKKLSANENKRKQVQHERRVAKKQNSFGIEQITQTQVNEMQLSVMTDLNTHIRAIVETDYPEALPLVGADFFATTQQFAAAEMAGKLKQALEHCKEELEAFSALALLSWAKQLAPAEAA